MAKLSDLLLLDEPDPLGDLNDIFEEEPVPLTTFIRDKKYLASPPLSDVQYNAVRHAEQVLHRETYPLMAQEWGEYWNPVRFVNLITLEWGKGSGKDHICRIIALRGAYLLLCLRDPQAYFQIPPQDSIHMLNVASSAGQAARVFFKPMTRVVDRKGCWFKDRIEGLAQTSIMFEKNIEAVSGHSSAEQLEGLNILIGVADEIDAFPSDEEVLAKRAADQREPARSADSIIKLLRSSAITRFPEEFKNCYLSWPRYRGSTIQILQRQAEDDNKKKGKTSRHYVSGPLPTWAVNPKSKREHFDDEYEQDPITAKGRYECQPAGATNPFFRNEAAIDQAFRRPDDPDPIEISYLLDESTEPPQWKVEFKLSPTFRAIEGAAYAMHGDIGITKDRAGVALSHVKEWVPVTRTLITDDEGFEEEVTDYLPHVVNDLTTSFQADIRTSPPREVIIDWYRQLLLFLEDNGFKVIRFTFDGFQSTDIMQWLKSRNIEAERVSTDLNNDVWDTLRTLIYDDRLEGPDRELLKTELKALQKLPNGKVDHPPRGSKDEADSCGGSVLGAILVGGREVEERTERYPGSTTFETAAEIALPAGLDDLDYRVLLT